MSEPTQPPRKVIVIEGDSNVNMINSLGDLSTVAHELSSTINHLREFIVTSLPYSSTRKKIYKQVNLIDRATRYRESRCHYCRVENDHSDQPGHVKKACG